MDLARPLPGVRRLSPLRVLPLLVVVLLAASVAALALGGVSLRALDDRALAVLVHIRLPRVLLAMLVGAGLGSAGAVTQGLLRNPLADPGLLGISGGASLATVTAVVLGHGIVGHLPPSIALYVMPLAGFAGSCAAGALLLALSRRAGETAVPTVILMGVGLSSLSGAGTGLLLHIANDAQLRSVTFWMLGSLGGTTPGTVGGVALAVTIGLTLMLARARSLDALALGESVARYLGVRVEREKRILLVAVSLVVGACVAAAGLIGFIGLTAAHASRALLGPSHRLLLPATALGGALLVLLADLGARTLVAPAELPIGVLTSLAGSPVLIGLVAARRHSRVS